MPLAFQVFSMSSKAETYSFPRSVFTVLLSRSLALDRAALKTSKLSDIATKTKKTKWIRRTRKTSWEQELELKKKLRVHKTPW
jgi:hypothetical protein